MLPPGTPLDPIVLAYRRRTLLLWATGAGDFGTDWLPLASVSWSEPPREPHPTSDSVRQHPPPGASRPNWPPLSPTLSLCQPHRLCQQPRPHCTRFPLPDAARRLLSTDSSYPRLLIRPPLPSHPPRSPAIPASAATASATHTRVQPRTAYPRRPPDPVPAQAPSNRHASQQAAIRVSSPCRPDTTAMYADD